VEAPAAPPETRSPDLGVRIARVGATGVFTLDRPKARNAVNAAMIAAMAAEIPALAKDPNVYGLVMRSSIDGMFSAGGDLREIAGRLRPGSPISYQKLMHLTRFDAARFSSLLRKSINRTVTK
jgi:enoyl-CoA hydratase/carnithine racemase